MSDKFYSNSFINTESDSRNELFESIYKYKLKDFKKALDCLFLISDFKVGHNSSFRQPVNMVIGKNDTELLLAMNYNKAIYGSTLLKFAAENPTTKEIIESSFVYELGMKTEGFIELPITSFNNVIKNLVKIFNENKDLVSREKPLLKYYQDKSNNTYKDLKKCVDAVSKSTKNFEKADKDKTMLIDPMFKSRNIETKPNMCFCILPFSNDRIELFDEVIKPELKKDCDINAIKSGDMFNANSDMIEDIWIKINEAAFIVADISDKNPNVFYELGICHTLGKKIILICDEESLNKDYKGKLPFDINTRFTYFYKNRGSGPIKVVEHIEKSLKEMNTIEQNIK